MKFVFLLLLIFIPLIASAHVEEAALSQELRSLYFLTFLASYLLFYGLTSVLKKIIAAKYLVIIFSVLSCLAIVLLVNQFLSNTMSFLAFTNDKFVSSGIVPGGILFLVIYSIVYLRKGRAFPYLSSSPFLAFLGLLLLFLLNILIIVGVSEIASATGNCSITLSKETKHSCYLIWSFRETFIRTPSPEECRDIPLYFSEFRSRCFAKAAMNDRSVELCKEIGGIDIFGNVTGKGNFFSGLCRAQLAEFLKDVSVCDQDVSIDFERDQFKFACYYLVAKSKKEAALCERIPEFFMTEDDIDLYDSSLDSDVFLRQACLERSR